MSSQDVLIQDIAERSRAIVERVRREPTHWLSVAVSAVQSESAQRCSILCMAFTATSSVKLEDYRSNKVSTFFNDRMSPGPSSRNSLAWNSDSK